MITQETCAAIYAAHREILAGEKLLADMKAARDRPMTDQDKHAPTLRDHFGHLRHLQLGIPSGNNGHQLFQVSPMLAESVIRAHIEHKRAELVEANEQARIELTEITERLKINE